MKDKIFVSAVISVIALTVVISITIGINVYNKNKAYVLDASSDDYMQEENALKAKSMYDTKEMKEEFLQIAKNLSNVVYSKLLDGTVTDNTALKSFIQSYNQLLSSNNWTDLGIEYPNKWIGTWYLDENGFVKFKFATKSIEPNWIKDEEVKDFVVVN